MNLAKTNHHQPAVRGLDYAPPSADLSALIGAKREGIAILPGDLTGERVAAIRDQLARVGAALEPVTAVRIAAWLKRLGEFVTNAPAIEGASSAACCQICAVCEDLPSGVWTQRAVLAWVRQPPRNGFPVGSRWPTASELYAFLKPLADQIRAERASLQGLLAIAEAGRPSERQRPSAAEARHVADLMAGLRREMAERMGDGA